MSTCACAHNATDSTNRWHKGKKNIFLGMSRLGNVKTVLREQVHNVFLSLSLSVYI